MPSSRFLFFFSVFFILGISLGSFFKSFSFLIPIFFILGIIKISLFLVTIEKKTKKRLKTCLAGVFLIVLIAGYFWHFLFDNRNHNLILDYNNEVEIKGFIIDEPDIREKTMHLTIKAQEIKNDKNFYEIKEKILVITEKYFQIEYNDEVRIKGKITEPSFFNGFDYPGYLSKDGVYLISFYPEIEVIGEKKTFFSLKGKTIESKNKAREIIFQSFSYPQSSVLAAMILGDKKRIPYDWQEKLSVSGIRHITAVSGMHIMILMIILTNFFAGMGLKTKKYFYFIIIFISFFIFMTGMQPSAVRAGIMGGCFSLSKITGRMNNSLRLITFAAFLMLFLNPLILKNDIGFQFSFMAVLGIIIFLPFFKKIFHILPEKPREILAVSFSAQIFVFPLMGYYFERVSLIFPLTNLLIIPVIYPIMIIGVVFVILSLFSVLLSSFLLIPLQFLLTYLIFIVDVVSGIPWASTNFDNISFILLFFYAFLFFGILNKKINKSELSYF